jgi:hypothetical protein
MAKRARGSSTRPGQRAPLQRSTAGRPTTPGQPTTTGASPVIRPASLTADEEARAAALEAQIVDEEKAAVAAARKAREARRVGAEPVPRGSIAVRAAEEYAYVARDVRRIAVIGGALIAILIGLWAVLEATGTAVV